MSKATNMGNATGAAAVEEWAAGDSRRSLAAVNSDFIVTMIEMAAFDLQLERVCEARPQAGSKPAQPAPAHR